MTSAEIITIGTEILLGELVDTNAQYIARQLRDTGIDLFRKTSVGDNRARIALAVQQSLERAQVVITTGGLGPTVDDPTREAIAEGVNLDLEFRPELWEQIRARFARFGRLPTENNRRQAYIPRGAIAIENPVGTAPAFLVEVNDKLLTCLPGVPREMEYLMTHAVLPLLRQRFPENGIILSRVLHTAGIGESHLDELIAPFEEMINPTVGLSAHSGQVDIRITAKGSNSSQAGLLITEVETQIRQRLGDWIYGADDETLEEAALRPLQEAGFSLAVVESGLGGELIRKLARTKGVFVSGEWLPEVIDTDELFRHTRAYRSRKNIDFALGVMMKPQDSKTEVHIALISPNGEEYFTRPFGGPPSLASRWAVNHCLDILRKLSIPDS
jgi:competence/damage-inducible protein CinA-like protein